MCVAKKMNEFRFKVLESFFAFIPQFNAEKSSNEIQSESVYQKYISCIKYKTEHFAYLILMK